jgi:hypothetical protein
MDKIIMYLLMAICLIGQMFVTKHKRIGYGMWVIADGAWAVFNFSQYKICGAIEQGILWTMFFIISLWGFIIFKKEK